MQIFGKIPFIKQKKKKRQKKSFCGLIKGISPKICILCARVKRNKRTFDFHSKFLLLLLSLVLFYRNTIKIQTNAYLF